MPILDYAEETSESKWLSPKNNNGKQWTTTECYPELCEEPSGWGTRHLALATLDNHYWLEIKPTSSVATADKKYEDFNFHVNPWKRETAHLSSLGKILTHPSYLRIIALASRHEEFLKFLLEEMQSDPDHWFSALTAITGEDPVSPESDFDESAAQWIDWAISRRIL